MRRYFVVGYGLINWMHFASDNSLRCVEQLADDRFQQNIVKMRRDSQRALAVQWDGCQQRWKLLQIIDYAKLFTQCHSLSQTQQDTFNKKQSAVMLSMKVYFLPLIYLPILYKRNAIENWNDIATSVYSNAFVLHSNATFDEVAKFSTLNFSLKLNNIPFYICSKGLHTALFELNCTSNDYPLGDELFDWMSIKTFYHFYGFFSKNAAKIARNMSVRIVSHYTHRIAILNLMWSCCIESYASLWRSALFSAG